MNLRLALYSDQIPPETDGIDRVVVGWLPKRGAVIGYVPSSPDRERRWFESRVEYYARYGVRLRFFGLEDEHEPSELAALLACDAIHLTGGNTFRFLYWLRARGWISELRRYALDGGVLIGVSAGAILMTPRVGTSMLCGDVPYEGMADGEGLSLVDFAIVPHHDGSERTVLGYSRAFEGTVYAIPDGSGIVVDGSERTMFGDVRAVRDGSTGR